MEKQELEHLRNRVPCAAVLEQSGFAVDLKESTRKAVKYRRKAQIIIVIHDGRGWFDPLAGSLDLEILDQHHGVAVGENVAGGVADVRVLRFIAAISDAGRYSPVTLSQTLSSLPLLMGVSSDCAMPRQCRICR